MQDTKKTHQMVTLAFSTPPAGALLQEGIDVIVSLNALRVGRITC